MLGQRRFGFGQGGVELGAFPGRQPMVVQVLADEADAVVALEGDGHAGPAGELVPGLQPLLGQGFDLEVADFLGGFAVFAEGSEVLERGGSPGAGGSSGLLCSRC